MAINAVSAAATNNASNLTLQDFLQVLMTQLTYQDPLKPMDNEQFMAQIAQFTSLEQTQQVNTNVQTLVGNQAAQQSIGLLGKTVQISTTSGPASGSVTNRSFRDLADIDGHAHYRNTGDRGQPEPDYLC
jgi:flagellar basal-body rod modification protein FlgD